MRKAKVVVKDGGGREIGEEESKGVWRRLKRGEDLGRWKVQGNGGKEGHMEGLNGGAEGGGGAELKEKGR